MEKAKEWVESIGEELKRKTGDHKSKSYLILRINMTVQRGNATSIISSLPAAKGLASGFCLQFINCLLNEFI